MRLGYLNVPGGFYLSVFLFVCLFYTKVCFGFPSNVLVHVVNVV